MRPDKIINESRRFDPRQFFYSRTDRRGVIRGGNRLFFEVSGYGPDALIGAPHKVVRHPDMPRGVFHLLWQTIQANEPMGAFVKNLAGDGRYYWVFATVLPLDDGYLSVRLGAQGPLFDKTQAIYARMLRAEAEGMTPEASGQLLLRELAAQVEESVRSYGKHLDIKSTVIFGGVSQVHQERALSRGADIVVACPGRLEDLMGQGHVDLSAIEVTILDEADHMADMGFLPVVTRILKQTPDDGQRLLFSATLDGGVDVLVTKFLHDPVTHSVDAPKAAVSTMEHHVLVVDADEKQALIETLASGTGRRVMFTRTKHRAKKLAKKLSQQGIPAVDLQGNLSQNARDRNLASFSQGDVRVLVATDVAARGVHVDDVELVVHIDPPAEHKSYLHRSGRTARAGAQGQVITIATREERRDVEKLMKQAGVIAEFSEVSIGSPVVADLVGERAERVEYVAPAQQQPSGRRPEQSHHRVLLGLLSPAARRTGPAPARPAPARARPRGPPRPLPGPAPAGPGAGGTSRWTGAAPGSARPWAGSGRGSRGTPAPPGPAGTRRRARRRRPAGRASRRAPDRR